MKGAAKRIVLKWKLRWKSSTIGNEESTAADEIPISPESIQEADNQRLCEQCSQIDWDDAFTRKENSLHQITWNLDDVRIRADVCYLCHFLLKLAITFEDFEKLQHRSTLRAEIHFAPKGDLTWAPVCRFFLERA